MIAAEATPQEPDTWVYLASAGAVLLVFLAGLAIGPFVKSYEALFLEQRHNRRRLQKAAHACMNILSSRKARKFSNPLDQKASRAVTEFRDLYWDDKVHYGLTQTDRTVGFAFITSVVAIDHAKTESEYLERRRGAYERYLDFQRPTLRWRRRLSTVRGMIPPVRKANFTALEVSDEISE